jgi:integrase
MKNQYLTDAAVRALPLPAKGKTIVLDGSRNGERVKGFGVRITAAGARSYILRYTTRSRERTFTIADATIVTAAWARKEAKRLRYLIEEGGDPLADVEAERAAPTVADLCDRFESEHLTRKRASTAADYKRMLKNHIRPALKNLKVADVAFSDIDTLHRKITKAGSPYAANRCVAVLSKMFNLAVRWRMRSDNPARGIERNAESKRKRYLSGDELARLTKALAEHEDKQAANAIRLLLLTGARRGEVLAARWADLDLTEGVWTKPGSTTKQKSDHTVPLSAPVRQLLSDIRDEQEGKHPKRPLGEFVFPSSSSDVGHVVELKRPWRTLCKAAKISGLRLHDLRHSFASHLASGGASLPLIGALLGHSNPQTTARYAHLFQDPQRAAAERVAAIVENAGKPPVEPTQIGRGRRR